MPKTSYGTMCENGFVTHMIMLYKGKSVELPFPFVS